MLGLIFLVFADARFAACRATLEMVDGKIVLVRPTQTPDVRNGK